MEQEPGLSIRDFAEADIHVSVSSNHQKCKTYQADILIVCSRREVVMWCQAGLGGLCLCPPAEFGLDGEPGS